MIRDALNVAVPQRFGNLEDKDIIEDVRWTRETDEPKLSAVFCFWPIFRSSCDMRTEKLGRLITISGTVTRITEVKPELLVGTFRCKECNLGELAFDARQAACLNLASKGCTSDQICVACL